MNEYEQALTMILKLEDTVAELLEACQNALGAYSALEALGADKELPGYESCLVFLKEAIRNAKGE